MYSSVVRFDRATVSQHTQYQDNESVTINESIIISINNCYYC